MWKDGKQFSHWATYANGSGATFEPGDRVSLTMSSFTLYAQWKEPECTLKIIGAYKDSRNRTTENASAIYKIRIYDKYGFYHDYDMPEIEGQTGVYRNNINVICHPGSKFRLYHASGRFWMSSLKVNNTTYAMHYGDSNYVEQTIPLNDDCSGYVLYVQNNEVYSGSSSSPADYINYAYAGTIGFEGYTLADMSQYYALLHLNCSTTIHINLYNGDESSSSWVSGTGSTSSYVNYLACKPGSKIVFSTLRTGISFGRFVYNGSASLTADNYVEIGRGARLEVTVPSDVLQSYSYKQDYARVVDLSGTSGFPDSCIAFDTHHSGKWFDECLPQGIATS